MKTGEVTIIEWYIRDRSPGIVGNDTFRGTVFQIKGDPNTYDMSYVCHGHTHSNLLDNCIMGPNLMVDSDILENLKAIMNI